MASGRELSSASGVEPDALRKTEHRLSGEHAGDQVRDAAVSHSFSGDERELYHKSGRPSSPRRRSSEQLTNDAKASPEHIQDIVRRLHNMEAVQNGFVLEREDVTRAITISLINRHHLLLAGPPGSAKTTQVRLAAAHIQNGVYFFTQLTPFSTVEDVFGPIDIAAYKDGRRQRIGDGMLQQAHVAVIDEIYNSNEAVLQSLLAPMYEGVYAERGRVHPIPLRTLLGTTNGIPTRDERVEKGLTGFHDRWLFRFLIDEIRSDVNFRRMLWTPDIDFHTYVPDPDAVVTAEELSLLAAASSRVRVPVAVYEQLVELRNAMQERNLQCSVRRWKQIHRALQTAAFLEGRMDVGEQEFSLLRHVLWNEEADIPSLERLLEGFVSTVKERVALTFGHILEVFADFEEQRQSLPNPADVNKLALEKRHRVEALIQEIDALGRRAGSTADTAAVESYLQRAYNYLHDLDEAAEL